MKLSINNLSFFLIITLAIIIFPKQSLAVSPWAYGKVTSETGALIPNLWVSWYDTQDLLDQSTNEVQVDKTDGYQYICYKGDSGCIQGYPITSTPYNLRFVKTWNNPENIPESQPYIGYFQFPGWNVSDCSNQDWKPSPYMETVCGKDENGRRNDWYNNWIDTDLNGQTDFRQATTYKDRPSFGCAKPSGIMRVVKPSSWTGTFTKIIFKPGDPGYYHNGIGNNYGWQNMGEMRYIPLPANLSASCPNPGTSALLSWNGVMSAEFYMLKINSSDPIELLASLHPPYTLLKTTPGQTYSWSLAACRYDEAGDCTRNSNNGCPNPPSYSCTNYVTGPAFTCYIPPTPTTPTPTTPTPTTTPTLDPNTQSAPWIKTTGGDVHSNQ